MRMRWPWANDKKRINTINDIADERVRKSLTRLTLRLLGGGRVYSVSSDEKGRRLESRWESAASGLDLPISPRNLEVGGYGYGGFLLTGLRSIMRPATDDPIVNKLKRFADEQELIRRNIGKTVLDFGCGAGALTRILQDCFGSDAHGIDRDRNMITTGNFFGVRNLHEAFNDHRPGIPSRNGAFQMVISNSALFSDPSRGMGMTDPPNSKHFHEVMMEIMRVTAVNGALLIYPDIEADEIIYMLRPYQFGYVCCCNPSDDKFKRWHLWQREDDTPASR